MVYLIQTSLVKEREEIPAAFGQPNAAFLKSSVSPVFGADDHSPLTPPCQAKVRIISLFCVFCHQFTKPASILRVLLFVGIKHDNRPIRKCHKHLDLTVTGGLSSLKLNDV